MSDDINREVTNFFEEVERGFLGDVVKSMDTNLENLGEGLSHLEGEGRKFINDPVGIKALQKTQQEALNAEREAREQERLDAISSRQIRAQQASLAAKGIRQRTISANRGSTSTTTVNDTLGTSEDILGL